MKEFLEKLNQIHPQRTADGLVEKTLLTKNTGTVSKESSKRWGVERRTFNLKKIKSRRGNAKNIY